MSTAPEGGGYHTSEDEQILHKLGYAQELFRGMGGFQNFAISFTIISILAGCLTSYYIAFNNGGPIAISWGWLIVGLMSTLISLAMAEIASAFPTAGGLYYWSSKLGSPAWGWFTGWFNLVGQIAVTAAIGYGLAIFATSLINLWFDYPNTKEWTLLTYTVVMLIAVVLNMFRVSVTAMLNTISAYWHMVGVLFIVLVLIIVPDNHQSVSYVFTQTVNNSGFSGTNFGSIVFWYVFGLGLLMSQYTITGFDASAHMAEETHQASRMAAVGMYMSVVVSVIFGWILLLAVTFAVPDTQGVLDAVGGAVTYIWTTSMSETWAEILLFICCVAQMFCLTASVTSASRMMFAFSRDRAVPGHKLWRKVAPNRVPVAAVCAIGVLAWALMIPTYWNAATGYLVGTSIAVIGLYIAFILPVILRFRMGDRFVPGAWTLGKHYKWIDSHLDRLGRDHHGSSSSVRSRTTGIPWKDGFNWDVANYAPLTGRRGADPLRRLVAHLGEELVQGPGADGHRRGARADGGADRVRLRDAGRLDVLGDRALSFADGGAPVGRPSAVQAPSALRKPGSAAVCSIRSKCSAAYPSKSNSSSDTTFCTTPHIASRKSDMKRMRSRVARPASCASPAYAARRTALPSVSSPWLTEKFARSKNGSPIPAYSQSTITRRSPASMKFALSRSLWHGRGGWSARRSAIRWATSCASANASGNAAPRSSAVSR